MVFLDRSTFFFLAETKHHGYVLFQARLHSPVDVTEFQSQLQGPTALAQSLGVVFVAVKTGIYFADVAGNVLPEIWQMTHKQLSEKLAEFDIDESELLKLGKAYRLFCHLHQIQFVAFPDMLNEVGVDSRLLGTYKRQAERKKVAEKRKLLYEQTGMDPNKCKEAADELGVPTKKLRKLEITGQWSLATEQVIALTAFRKDDSKAIELYALCRTEEPPSQFILHIDVFAQRGILRGVVRSRVNLHAPKNGQWLGIASSADRLILACGAIEHKSRLLELLDAKQTDAGLWQLSRDAAIPTKIIGTNGMYPSGVTVSANGQVFFTTRAVAHDAQTKNAVYELNQNGSATHIVGGSKGLCDGSEFSAQLANPGRLTILGESNMLFVYTSTGIRALVRTNGLRSFLTPLDELVVALRCKKKHYQKVGEPKVQQSTMGPVNAAAKKIVSSLEADVKEALADLNSTARTTNGENGTGSNQTKTGMELFSRSWTRAEKLTTMINLNEHIDCRAAATLGNEEWNANMRRLYDMPDILQVSEHFIVLVQELYKMIGPRKFPYYKGPAAHYYERREPAAGGSVLMPPFPRRSAHNEAATLSDADRDMLQRFEEQVKSVPQNTVRSKLKYSANTLPLQIYDAMREREENSRAGVRQVRQDNLIASGTWVIFPSRFCMSRIPRYYALGRVATQSLDTVTVRVCIGHTDVPRRYEETLIRTDIPLDDMIELTKKDVEHEDEDGRCTLSESGEIKLSTEPVIEHDSGSDEEAEPAKDNSSDDDGAFKNSTQVKRKGTDLAGANEPKKRKTAQPKKADTDGGRNRGRNGRGRGGRGGPMRR